MTIPSFLNKIVTSPSTIVTTAKYIPLSKKISTNLFNTFSNLNFSGVYRIGSETIKEDCFIGSAYNITLKISQHLNLLLRNEHHSKSLQDWVNSNGIENIDISVLSWTPSNPDLFEAKEQYYINSIKPKFNTILNRKEIVIFEEEVKYPVTWLNKKFHNDFGNNIMASFGVNNPKKRIKVTIIKSEIEDERKTWKPTIVLFDEYDNVTIIRGDITNIKPTKKVAVTETVVYRSNVFKSK